MGNSRRDVHIGDFILITDPDDIHYLQVGKIVFKKTDVFGFVEECLVDFAGEKAVPYNSMILYGSKTLKFE